MTVKIGSLFAGIGGFELGLERSWVNAKTVWQVEKNTFCQSILSKHWPESIIYNDVKDITKDKVKPVDVLIGGFPCQDISLAGKQKGVHDGKKSSLWWEMWRIASELRVQVIIMENVANIIRLGGVDVIGSLTQIGYDCEWTVISARQFGAPHLRERWFCVAYSQRLGLQKHTIESKPPKWQTSKMSQHGIGGNGVGRSHQTPNTNSIDELRAIRGGMLETRKGLQSHPWCGDGQNHGSHNGGGYWKQNPYPSPFCRVDDGIPNRVARLKALGNAIVPQCSQWVGDQILKSGLLDDLLEDK